MRKKSILFAQFKKKQYFCARFLIESVVSRKTGGSSAFGKMAEWSIASVLKTEVLKGTGGSNPSLSA